MLSVHSQNIGSFCLSFGQYSSNRDRLLSAFKTWLLLRLLLFFPYFPNSIRNVKARFQSMRRTSLWMSNEVTRVLQDSRNNSRSKITPVTNVSEIGEGENSFSFCSLCSHSESWELCEKICRFSGKVEKLLERNELFIVPM